MARAPNPDRGKFEVVAAPDEIRCWLACAEAEDRSLSAWVRRACNEAARRAERVKGGVGEFEARAAASARKTRVISRGSEENQKK